MLRPHVTSPENRGARGRRRMGTVFGWVAGGSLGLLINYGLFLFLGEGYPVVPTTFALFVVGCFGVMFAADRLGERAFRVMGIAAGILLAAALAMIATVLMAPAR